MSPRLTPKRAVEERQQAHNKAWNFTDQAAGALLDAAHAALDAASLADDTREGIQDIDGALVLIQSARTLWYRG